MAIEIGHPAPDFTLKGHDDQEHTLSAYRGRPVVLAFYPADFSGLCTKEHGCFVEDLAKFGEFDAQVFGISVDSVWSHKAFAQQQGISYPLLADFHPKGEVASKYGLWLGDKGVCNRATVVIDRNGKIASLKVHDLPNQRDNAEILESLKRAA